MRFVSGINGRVLLGLLFNLCGCATEDFPHEAPDEASLSGGKHVIVTPEEVELDRVSGLTLYEHKPFTGRLQKHYEHGGLLMKSDYLDGKRHGPLTKWFENGQISYSSNFIRGKANGIEYSWWPNGNLRSEASVTDGVIDGTVRQWYRSGKLFKHMQYNQGIEAGLQRGWRENGKLFSNYEYINGRVYGLKRSNMCFELENESLKSN